MNVPGFEALRPCQPRERPGSTEGRDSRISPCPERVPGWDEAVVILGRAGAASLLLLLVLEQLQDVVLDHLLD